MSRDYEEYMKTLKKISPKQSKNQQRIRRSRENIEFSTSSDIPSSPSMDVIFSAEDRNRFESERKEENRKLYQQSLEKQIEEQKAKKLKDVERKKREEMLFEQ